MWDDVPFTFAATFTSVTVCFNFLPTRCNETKKSEYKKAPYTLLMALLVFLLLRLRFLSAFWVSGTRVWWIIIISWDIKAPRNEVPRSNFLQSTCRVIGKRSKSSFYAWTIHKTCSKLFWKQQTSTAENTSDPHSRRRRPIIHQT